MPRWLIRLSSPEFRLTTPSPQSASSPLAELRVSCVGSLRLLPDSQAAEQRSNKAEVNLWQAAVWEAEPCTLRSQLIRSIGHLSLITFHCPFCRPKCDQFLFCSVMPNVEVGGALYSHNQPLGGVWVFCIAALLSMFVAIGHFTFNNNHIQMMNRISG